MTCKEGLRSVFGQMDRLLEQLSAEAYARPLPLFEGSSLGQHFRHIINFAECLLRGWREGLPVDYAARHRDPSLERRPEKARAAIARLVQQMDAVPEAAAVQVRADFFEAGQPAERPVVASTFGRELMFVHDHAIHHLAMIRMGIRTCFPDIRLDPAVGVAPATLKYWQQQRKCDERRV